MTPEELAATPPLQPVGLTAATGGFTDPMQIAATPPVVPPPALSPSKLSYEPKPGWMQGYVNLMQKHLEVGVGGMSQSVQGWGVGTGLKNFDDAKKQVESEQYMHAVQDIHDYANGNGYMQWLANVGGGWVTEQVPGMAAGLGGMGAGAGVALMAGGPVGWGAAIGGGLTVGLLAAGHAVYGHMERGGNINTARVVGLGSGILSGALGMLGGKATATLIGGAATEAAPLIAQRLAANLNVQIPVNMLQSYTDSILRFAATHADPESKPYTIADGMRDINAAAQQAFATAPVFALGGEAAGQVGGAALRSKTLQGFVSEERGSSSPFSILPEEAVTAFTKHLDKMVAKKKQERDAQMLDQAIKETAPNEDAAHFEEKFNQLDAAGLEFYMQMELPDAVRKTVETRWAKLTGNSEKLGSDAPGVPIDAAEEANRIMGFGKPAPKTQQQKETAQKAKELISKKPPPAMPEEAEQIRDIVDTANVYLRPLKGAAVKVLAAAKNAQAEGRELTEDEQIALEREAFLNMTPDQAKERLTNKLSGAIKKFVPWNNGGKTLGMLSFGQAAKLGMAFQYASVGSDFDKLIQSLDTSAAVNHADTLQATYDDLRFMHLGAATGLDHYQLETAAWHAAGTEVEINFTDANGKDATSLLTLDEAMKYLMLMKNADALEGLTSKKGNAFTTKADRESFDGKSPLLGEADTSTEEALETALASAQVPSTTGNPFTRKPVGGAVYLQMIEGLENFYDDMGQVLKDSYERLNPGKTLKLQSYYGGKVQRAGTVERETGLEPFMPGHEFEANPEALPDVSKKNPGFTKLRGNADTYILPGGALEGSADRCRTQARWEAMTEPAKKWNAFINDPEVVYSMDSQFGKGLRKSLLNGYLDAVSGQMKAQGESNHLIDSFMSSKSLLTLLAKPMQAVKHAMTLQQFALYTYKGEMIPASELASGVLNFVENFKQAKAEISMWDEVVARYRNKARIGANVNVDAFSPRQRKWQTRGMQPFKMGDAVALYPGVHAVYQWVLKKTGSPEIAKREAINAFDSLLASASVAKLGDLSRHPILKQFKQFRQPEDALAQAVIIKLRDAANFPTEQNLKNAVKSVVISNVAAGLFVLPDALWAYTFANKKEGEEKIHEFFQKLRLGNWQAPVADAVYSLDAAMGNALWNEKNHVWELKLPILEAANKTIGLLQDLKEVTQASDIRDFIHQVLTTGVHAAQASTLAGVAIPEQPFHWADYWFKPQPKEEGETD